VQLTCKARGCGGVCRYEGEDRDDKMHGQGTFTKHRGLSYTGTFLQDRPTQGVLTEADGRRFDVTYASDCACIDKGPAPKTKVCGWACGTLGAGHVLLAWYVRASCTRQRRVEGNLTASAFGRS